jgi:hypothetical protein
MAYKQSAREKTLRRIATGLAYAMRMDLGLSNPEDLQAIRNSYEPDRVFLEMEIELDRAKRPGYRKARLRW